MLDLKALLSKILNMFQISETVTFTKFNKSWNFYKIGSVVYVYAPSDISGSVPAGFSTIGTLPTSMRPTGNVYLGVTNAGTLDYRLTITAAGLVQYYQPSASSSAHNAGFCGYSYVVPSGGGLNPITWLRTKLDTIFTPILNGGGVWYARFKGTISENTFPPKITDYIQRGYIKRRGIIKRSWYNIYRCQRTRSRWIQNVGRNIFTNQWQCMVKLLRQYWQWCVGRYGQCLDTQHFNRCKHHWLCHDRRIVYTKRPLLVFERGCLAC